MYGRQRPVYPRFQIDQSRLRAPVVSFNASFLAAMSARARGGEDDDDGRQLGLGDRDGVHGVASCSEHWRPVMDLHLVRGSSSLLESTAAVVAAAADPVTTETDVDAEVPAKEMQALASSCTW